MGNYRRPHGDVDVVYIVNSISWNEFCANPRIVPEERQSLLQIAREPELYDLEQSKPIGMGRMGAQGIRMEGRNFPITADFIETYRDNTGEEEFIMMPIYDGGSNIKIPLAEIRVAAIDRVTTMVPSPEVQYILKEQGTNVLETLKGGILPDRRKKTKADLEDLSKVVHFQKVEELKRKGVGINFSLRATAKFRAYQLIDMLVG